jgi:hypothetical protein
MGRMKEVCMDIIEANGGIPEGMTIADVARMKDLEIFEWKEYEKRQNNFRSEQYQSENSGEIGKIEQVQKKFSSKYGEAREEKGSEQ